MPHSLSAEPEEPPKLLAPPRKAYQRPAVQDEFNLTDMNARQAALAAQAMAEAFKGEKEQTERAKKSDEEATQDSLTGLFNRRYFDRCLQNLKEKKDQQRTENMEQHRRSTDRPTAKPTFTLILIDIDHFKDFNDQYGHQTGDRVLRTVADKLTSSVRIEKSDVITRFGGEEFAVILEDVDEEKARTIADRIRQTIERETKTRRKITVSIGVAEYRDEEQGETPLSVEELILRADKALYYAKEHGRNAVHVWHNPEVQEWAREFAKGKTRKVGQTGADDEDELAA